MEFLQCFLFSFWLLVELVLVLYFCCKNIPRKKGWTWKAIVAGIVGLAITVLSSMTDSFIGGSFVEYFEVRIFLYCFFFIFGCVFFLYKANFPFAFFVSTVSSIIVFMSLCVGSLVVYSINIALNNLPWWYEIIFQIVSFLIVFPMGYHFFVKRFRDKIKKSSFSVLAIFAGLFLVVSFALRGMETALSKINSSYLLMMLVVEIFYSLIILFLYYGLLNQRESEEEMAMIKQIWKDDKKHYEMQKESVEMINIKVHDLKHQIQDMKEQGALSDKLIKKLEESADIYQSVVQTGNDVLDVILSSVSLRCQKNEIQLTVMADGGAVTFMDDADIYSLFGNMLDNAIEHEVTISDPNLRFISLTIKKKEDIVYIHSENYYEPKTEGGDLLKSSKEDKINHGFGTKSMANIVSKYKGVIHFNVVDQMFQVDAMICAPKEDEHEKA